MNVTIHDLDRWRDQRTPIQLAGTPALRGREWIITAVEPCALGCPAIDIVATDTSGASYAGLHIRDDTVLDRSVKP